MEKTAKLRSVSVARAVVHRSSGETSVYYSHDKVPVWQFKRWLKLKRHLRFMRAEDRKAGHGN